jgi:uncharacterized membrane protein
MVLAVFAVLAIIGQVLNVFLCLAHQIFSPMVGGLAFVFLYMLVFAAAWLIAVRIAARWERQAAERQPAHPATLQTSAR